MMVKAVFYSQELLLKLFNLLKACINGVWLGLLTPQTFHKIDEEYYNQNMAMYGDAKYNKSGLRKWEKQVVDDYLRNCKHLLVTSAGGGREVLALRQMGFDVDGFECHPGLRNFANNLLEQEGIAPIVMAAPRDKCPDLARIYDGVIVGWGAYMLIQTKRKRIDFLRTLRLHLPVNAPVVVSFFSRSSNGSYHRIVAGIANIFRFLLVRDRIELGDDLAPGFAHYFTEQELAKEMIEAGFELKYYSSKQYGHAVGIACEVDWAVEIPASDLVVALK